MTDGEKKFYITTTLPYVNSDPHVGFAMEVIRADVIARHKELMGYDVFFNTGTDEHGQKIYNKAVEAGMDTQKYVDEYAERFKGLQELLGLSEGLHFIRTTDEKHVKAAQEFWKLCDKNEYIYKKTYQAKYCVGCELEKTDSELVDGCCPLHPGVELELIDEENYFFKFSEFEKPLLEFYEKNPNFVIPDKRFNEIKSFIKNGLKDFSISRLATKMPWGIAVPGDDDHVMYVWFDALVNYISTLGWPDSKENFEKYWVNGNTVQYCGKDNLRQQSAMWQAMLIAAFGDTKYCSNQIVINGFINSGGQKMSKSLGNVINPYDIVEKYGTDALRYYLLRHISSFEDSDMTMEKFHEAYTANLVNGLGNLVSRVMNMIENYHIGYTFDEDVIEKHKERIKEWRDLNTDSFRLDRETDLIWKKINEADEFIAREEPFKKIKTNKEEAERDLVHLIESIVGLIDISILLEPIMPKTAEKIQEVVGSRKKPTEPLFPRIEE